MRTEDGRGSGWVGAQPVEDVTPFNAGQDVTHRDARRPRARPTAKALEPGKYTVILEPAAAAGLISFMMNFFDARQADEGRSFLSKKGGGNKIGEQVFDPRVKIFADPWDPDAPVMPWDDEGLPREKHGDHRQGQGRQSGVLALLGAEAGQARDRRSPATC